MRRSYLILVFLVFAGCVSHSKFPVTDHCDDERLCHADLKNDKSFWSVKKWTVNHPDADYPDWLENKFKPELPKELFTGKIAATFINHASFLLQTKNFNFLTDPVLPPIQFIVISHNHYDHMDLQALEYLHKKFKPVFIIPLGNTKPLKHIDGIQTVELDWWQSTTVVNNGETAKITLVPAQHWCTMEWS